jgi:hypothetical protein
MLLHLLLRLHRLYLSLEHLLLLLQRKLLSRLERKLQPNNWVEVPMGKAAVSNNVMGVFWVKSKSLQPFAVL